MITTLALAACSSSDNTDTGIGFGGGMDAAGGADAVTMDSTAPSNDSGSMMADIGQTLDSGSMSADTAAAAADSGSGGMDAMMLADSGMMGGAIPDPGSGNAVDQNFTSVEPNDTPQQATPLGKASSANVHVWVGNNVDSATDSNDYFVFQSGTMPGQFTFYICVSGGITMLTATLWQVTAGQMVTPPIHTWSGAGPCIMTAATGDAPLMANTNYLFGLTATGAGTYSA